MITKITIPKVSANVEEETVTAWLRNEGDPVKKGDPIAELTTDKATFELECPRSGILRKILAKEKSVLPVGYIIALVGKQDDPLPDVSGTNQKILTAHRGTGRSPEKGRKAKSKQGPGIRATPAARRLAREQGLDLAKVKAAMNVDIINESTLRKFMEA